MSPTSRKPSSELHGATRWVTSNAQLADCLTKSMDASVLRECLRSGRCSLFGEGKILQQRSDKKQRLKWAKKVSASSPFLLSSSSNQYFSETDSKGQVIRVHRTLRSKLFSPIGVQDCPVDLQLLCLERVTEGRTTSGERICEKDFWPGTRGHYNLGCMWTGRTFNRVY